MTVVIFFFSFFLFDISVTLHYMEARRSEGGWLANNFAPNESLRDNERMRELTSRSAAHKQEKQR